MRSAISRSTPLTLAVVSLFLPAAGALAAPAPSTSALEREIASVLPTREEDAWLEVPWRTNIFEAIEEAGRTKKPVFLWVMNGNPLGCA
jgi:hypothetical protein